MSVVKRTVYPVVPPKVEYSLTALGRHSKPILDLLEGWGKGILNLSFPGDAIPQGSIISGRPMEAFDEENLHNCDSTFRHPAARERRVRPGQLDSVRIAAKKSSGVPAPRLCRINDGCDTAADSGRVFRGDSHGVQLDLGVRAAREQQGAESAIAVV